MCVVRGFKLVGKLSANTEGCLLLLFRGSGDPLDSEFCLETEPSAAVRWFNDETCLKRTSCASWSIFIHRYHSIQIQHYHLISIHKNHTCTL